MTKFAALLRGIAPMNPNMHNEKLRGVCEFLGLKHVQTVISSGNVVLETESADPPELEATLEAAWRSELGSRAPRWSGAIGSSRISSN